MKNNDFDFEELNDESEVKSVSLNLDSVKKNVPTFTSRKLCEMIVCDRYFGFAEKVSIHCMEELAKRREAGDNFDFETYIDNAYKELPQLNFNMPDLRSVLNQVINKKSK